MPIRRSLALLAGPAEPFMTGIGWVKFPVYTFSGDLGSHGTACAECSACARAGPPLYTEALAPTSNGGADFLKTISAERSVVPAPVTCTGRH